MSARSVAITGIGFWAETLPDWPTAATVFRAEAVAAEPSKCPAPACLAPAERRRAPDTVRVALQAASEAVSASGYDAAALTNVFASAQGDLGLTDYMCATLADDPSAVSPTKFHNSVHNAPVGYWSIANHAQLNSTAICAYDNSFAAGLLEALTLCSSDKQPVLFCAYDIAATGALAQVTHSEHLLAVALVLAPPGSTGHQLNWSITGSDNPDALDSTALQTEPGRNLADNAMADALPFCEELALLTGNPVILRVGQATSLRLELTRIN